MGMLWKTKGLITICQLRDVTSYVVPRTVSTIIIMANVTHLDKNPWGWAKTQVSAMQLYSFTTEVSAKNKTFK